MNSKSKHIFRRIYDYIRPYRMYVFLILVFSVLESGLFVYAPKLAGDTLNLLANIANDNSEVVLNDILKNVIFLFVVYSVYSFSSSAISYFGNLIAARVTYKLRDDISLKLNKVSLPYVNLLSQGDILSRVVNDVENLTDMLKDGIQRVVSAVVMSVGILAMMFAISVKMTIITLTLLFVAAIFSVIIIKCSQKHYKKYQETLGVINDNISETFLGLDIIKTMSVEESFSKKFESLNDELYECAWKSQFISGLASPIMELVSNLNYVIVCVMGGYMVLTQNFTIGDISAFIAYSGQINRPLVQFAGLFGMFQQTFVSAERVFEILDAPEENTLLSGKNVRAKFAKSIKIEGVNFGYEDGKNILKGINLEIPKGKTIAIVGKTGSGKTTLINVLMAFYKATEGKIVLDGKDINEMSLEEYRSLFGLVSQDVWLYNGTILENIRYGNLKATDEDVKKAAENVGIHHFIESLPDGYNTEINEYTDNISQGQRQLISFARMMISNAQILIMDEATALVDSGTEEKIQSSINKFFKDKTMIIIAHRLSTIENADTIVMLDDGRILEKGSHKELMDFGGAYSKLYNSQFLNI